jgi:hypothetical protein
MMVETCSGQCNNNNKMQNSPLFIKRQALMCGGVKVYSTILDFTPGEGDHGAHWIGGWVGPRDGLDAVK